MKKLAIISIFSFSFITTCFAQLPKMDTSRHVTPYTKFPTLYLGFGVGLDNYCGILGIGATAKIVNPIYIRVGAGIGSWGTKLTGTLLYKEKPLSGWTIGVGYSYSTGLSSFSPSLQTVDANGNTVTKNVNMTLLPASTLNLTAAYDWYYHNKNFFYLEFGYFLPFQSPPPYRINDGSVLNNISQSAISIDAPGGIVLGVGLMFGTN